MGRLDEAKARMRGAKAAKLGMTLEQFDAHVAREQERLDAIRHFYSDRDACRAVIAKHAAAHGRTWSVS
jgi:hypothetical protein